MQDTRLQKKASLEAAQQEAAQLQKQLADLKADLQRAESTIEVSGHDPVLCVALLLHCLISNLHIPICVHDLFRKVCNKCTWSTLRYAVSPLSICFACTVSTSQGSAVKDSASNLLLEIGLTTSIDSVSMCEADCHIMLL